jgi:hypothetical protein
MQSFSAPGGGGLARLVIAGAVFASVLVAAFVVSGVSSGTPDASRSNPNGAGVLVPGASSGGSSTMLTHRDSTTTVSVTSSIGKSSQTLLIANQTGLGVISGKVTIVLCPEPAVVNASLCKVPPDMYSTRQLVLTASSGGVVNIPLNPDGTFTAQIPTGTYQVSISNCNFLGCDLPSPSSISLSASTTTVTVCFNCAPR